MRLWYQVAASPLLVSTNRFSGPVKEKLQTQPFTPWERLTQALLLSNELIYVN